MMVGIIYFLLFTFSVYNTAKCSPPSNDDSGKKLCFNTTENGMSWPITDPNEPNYGPIHGMHCYHLTLEFSTNPPQNLFDQMRYEHCRKAVVSMYNNLVEEPSVYVISNTLCHNLMSFSTKKQKRDTYFVYLPIWRRFISDNDYLQRFGDNNIYEKIAKTSENQYHLYNIIGGSNFGQILWKAFVNESQLTISERNYYRSLDSIQVTRLSALGIVCANKANNTKAIELLERVIQDTSAIPVGAIARNFD